MGVLGVLSHPRDLGVLLTLFQPEVADYAPKITASTPGFENLKTSLLMGASCVLPFVASLTGRSLLKFSLNQEGCTSVGRNLD